MSTTPLTDAINALTTYANETTGASDTNLSDAVGTLVAGYGGGGGEWTTDGIASRAEPNGAITITTAVSTIKERAFFNCSGITELTIEGDPFIEGFAFSDCRGLTKINAPNLTSFRSSLFGTGIYIFQNCSALQGVVFPKFGNHVIDSYDFQNCTALTFADFKSASRLGGSDVFRSTGLDTLIIRKTDGVTTLQTVDVFRLSPFASGGSGGTLYVPQAQISSYQSANNWSTILGYANNSIQAIEGSQYETHYADGTPIE